MTRSSGGSEQLWYGPMGELIKRRQGQQATWDKVVDGAGHPVARPDP